MTPDGQSESRGPAQQRQENTFDQQLDDDAMAAGASMKGAAESRENA